ENIIEDGLNDFFINHINRYNESRKLPINFIGSIAFGFKDMLENICNTYQLHLGKVMQDSLEGLIEYHKN
ncbi:MAG: N-acetylglucosamine kinase, partial [Ginsengibacter sp.]